MKELKECIFKVSYSVPKDDVVTDFIIPALKCAIQYDRATGYFTSESLIRASLGLCAIGKNGGHIRLITSPRLNIDDLKAINEGYELRQAAIDSMKREFVEVDIPEYKERLGLLAELIATGLLDIKVCVLKTLSKTSMFHPKFGIITDSDGDSIYFNGSMNETLNGTLNNWEYIDVLNSWENKHNVETNKNTFEQIWNNTDPDLIVFDIPDVIKQLILQYRPNNIDGVYNLDHQMLIENKPSKFFIKPSNISLYDYQRKAIENWEVQNFNGLYNMATGTGKTITALSSLERLCNRLKKGCAVFIVCPLLHLVEQWGNEVRRFGVSPIIGHSKSIQKDWKELLDNSIRALNCESINSKGFYDSFCFITTNNTFKSEYVQECISKIKGNSVLVVDEVHNMGSEKSIISLPDNFNFRLGLSATIERYNDPTGTNEIKKYFGPICIDYGLEQAIAEKKLTPYYYHPIMCVMSSDEYSRFLGLNQEIRNTLKTVKNIAKQTAIINEIKLNGAKLVAGMDSKYDSLQEIIKTKYRKDNLMLVYCGNATIKDESLDKGDVAEKERLVDRATDILGNKLDMKVSQFTFKESLKDRKFILEDFEEKRIQALIAIRCLDEGVDIPAIKTAFITSSSNNPKEYIQRRGRVLRRSDKTGKEFATIYDFIAVPRNLSTINDQTQNKNFDILFLSKEIKRMVEFSRISIDPEETKTIITEIEKAYNVDMEDIINDRNDEGL